MTSRITRIGFTAAAGLGVFAGAAGLTAAASGNNAPAPTPVGIEAPGPDVEEPGDTGINCENGIDTATGAECDGGPAVAQAEEATEAPDADEDAATDAAASTDANSASGIVSAQVAPAQTDPTPVPAETETEGAGDEADDGIDHQFEGEEIGENGNGIPDADDLNGTEETG
ncbi:hypothetical protein [Ilumatobacter sp.]|uniref:hypothetical protein n=1 Tax=Ilumatobacter sp. TaxID=1967498 RepID=UPI0037530B70